MISSLPPLSVDTAWERYVALVRRQDDEPGLRTNFNHQREIARAHKRFCDAINATEDDAA